MNSVGGGAELANGDVATMMENFQAKKTTSMLNRLNSTNAVNSGNMSSSLPAAGTVSVASGGINTPSQVVSSSRMKRSQVTPSLR